MDKIDETAELNEVEVQNLLDDVLGDTDTCLQSPECSIDEDEA